jgi:hypothetical protein
MTLLGVAQADGVVWLGADGVVMSGADAGGGIVHMPYTKVHKASKMNVLFGFTGNVAVGEPFNDWFRDQTFGSWADLERASAHKWSGLIGEVLENLNRAKAVHFEPPHFLIGGFIADVQKVVYLDDEGLAQPVTNEADFYGIGATAAHVGWNLARHFGEAASRSTLTTVLEECERRIMHLGPPIQVLEVRV